MTLPHDVDGKECSCIRCLMAVRKAVEAAREVVLANIAAVLAIRDAQELGASYRRRLEAGLEPLRLAGVER